MRYQTMGPPLKRMTAVDQELRARSCPIDNTPTLNLEDCPAVGAEPTRASPCCGEDFKSSASAVGVAWD
jgi:hypothetical protein